MTDVVRTKRTMCVALLTGALLTLSTDNGVAARHVFVGLQRNGVAGATGLFFVSGVAISPDGAHVYTGSGGFGHSVVTFSRGATTGGLGFVEALSPAGAQRMVLSSDGQHLYAGDPGSQIEAYERDGVTGKVTLVEDEPADGAVSIDISPDGLHVYAAGFGVLEVYSRNAGTGELTFVEHHQDGVAGVDGLNGALDVTISPDGAHVYAAGTGDDAVSVFSRNAGTGELTFVEFQQEGVGGVGGLGTVSGVRVSPDNNHVYASGVNGGSSGGLAIFSRNTATGALTFVTYTAGGSNGFGRVAISPDGAQVYLLKLGQSRLGVFARDTVSGALTFEEDLIDDIGGVDGLSTPEDIVVSPDSRHVYVVAGESTVAAFQRIAVACSPAPLGGCFQPTLSEKALLVVKDDTLNDAKDKLVFKWLKGEAVTVGDFGDPAATANDYALCVYDATADPQPIAELLAPAGGGCGKAADGGGVPCWKAIPTKGFSYKRKDTHPDGVVAAKLLAGEAGKAKIVLKAKKDFTPTPGMPLALPVTVQLQNADGTCWTATYSTALVNESGFFKAKAD